MNEGSATPVPRTARFARGPPQEFLACYGPVVDQLLTPLEEKNITFGMFIDFDKASDILDYSILLKK